MSASLPTAAAETKVSYSTIATPRREALGTTSTTENESNSPRSYVVTVGCFDVFHHGHEALLSHMQEYGNRLLVGVHDDQSIFVNKKMRVAQTLEERCRAVQEFATDMIEIFHVTEADPTSALKQLYAHHEELAAAQGYTIDWKFMRGKDMPHFPGRVFIESVGMPIVWHDYTRNVSSTMIRNEIIPLARSLVNFAREQCLNEAMLQLLEKAAMIDYAMVMKYVIQTLDSLSVPFPPSEDAQPSPSSSLSDSSDAVSKSGTLHSVPASPSTISSSDNSAAASPAISSAIPSPLLSTRSDAGVLGINEIALPEAHSGAALPPQPSVMLLPPLKGSQAQGLMESRGFAARLSTDAAATTGVSASPKAGTPRVSPRERQNIFLAMINGLFSLYHARSTQLKTLTQSTATKVQASTNAPGAPAKHTAAVQHKQEQQEQQQQPQQASAHSPFVVITPCN